MNKYFKKRDSRIDYWTPITIEESGVCFIYRARLANYSMSGIYFETDLLLHPGTKVYIGIQDSTHRFFSEDHGSFLVKIIWRKSLNKLSFNYGYGAKMIFDKAEKKSQKTINFETKELRKNRRKQFSKPTYFTNGNKYYKGTIKNLSSGGAFIKTKIKLTSGDKLKLVVSGPKKYILLKGEIIHFNMSGFGMKFTKVSKVEKFPGAKKYNEQLTM